MSLLAFATPQKQLSTNHIQLNLFKLQENILRKHDSIQDPVDDKSSGEAKNEDTLMLYGEMSLSTTELDPEVRRGLYYYIQDMFSTYLIDYSMPAETNIPSYSYRFGDLEIEELKKTRLPLGMSVAGLSAAFVAALIGFPQPYNWISAIALGGPLFVSAYGFMTQKN